MEVVKLLLIYQPGDRQTLSTCRSFLINLISLIKLICVLTILGREGFTYTFKGQHVK